jgi:plastocyanin
MVTIRRVTTICLLLLLGLLLAVSRHLVQGEVGHPEVINLHLDGPQPPRLEVAAGTAVLWVSHLAPTKLVVATVSFTEGQRVAQATTSVEGYNGFTLEAGHFVGRMEGSGGKVVLRFVTPGEYTYTVDHHEHLTGTIVVRK